MIAAFFLCIQSILIYYFIDNYTSSGSTRITVVGGTPNSKVVATATPNNFNLSTTPKKKKRGVDVHRIQQMFRVFISIYFFILVLRFIIYLELIKYCE